MKEECVLRVAEDDVRRKQQKKLKKLERKSHAKVGTGCCRLLKGRLQASACFCWQCHSAIVPMGKLNYSATPQEKSRAGVC